MKKRNEKAKTIVWELNNYKQPIGIAHYDRKRFWTNYNAELVNRISEVKNSISQIRKIEL